jgi:hypothetical protein
MPHPFMDYGCMLGDARGLQPIVGYCLSVRILSHESMAITTISS